MDRKIAGLLGAAAVLTTMTCAQAAPPAESTEMVPATSYLDLIDPIPDAWSQLKADDVKGGELPKTELAEVSVQIGHHHHDHRGFYVRPDHGHHHYHHSHY